MATGVCTSSVPEQLPVDSRQVKLDKYVAQELKYHTLLHGKRHNHAVFLSRCKWPGLPSLLPLIVVSDEMLWA